MCRITWSKARLTRQTTERLRNKLEDATRTRQISLDEALDNDLREIVHQKSSIISESHPKDSFARIFWENQERSMSFKNSKSMRWDPLMIRWCLYLRHLSSGSYEMLRDSGFIRLPSQRTLRDYTYFTKVSVGFSCEIDRQLMVAAKIDTCPERDKCVMP